MKHIEKPVDRMNRLESTGICPYCEKQDKKTTRKELACCVDAARAARIGTGLPLITEPGRIRVRVHEPLQSGMEE